MSVRRNFSGIAEAAENGEAPVEVVVKLDVFSGATRFSATPEFLVRRWVE